MVPNNPLVEIIARLRSSQNPFWKKMLYFWAFLLAISFVLGDLSQVILLVADEVPERVVAIAKELKWISLAGATMAKLTYPDTKTPDNNATPTPL
jgi:hypothetical protein